MIAKKKKRWFGDQNVKGKGLKHLENNTGEDLCDMWLQIKKNKLQKY